jgi:pyrroloquinoline-quinone synthase
LDSTNLITSLDSMVARRHLLTHPFYQAWSAGHLSAADLQDHAAQYYRHVAAFPRYLSAIHSRCDDRDARQAILENLTEEESGDRDHPELWIRFAEEVGVGREELRNAEPRETTRNLVDTYMRIVREGSVPAGLAALYVYESQMPLVCATKIDGLRRFYGIRDEQSIAFFRAHQEADVEHSRRGAALIEKLVETSEDGRAVMEAADRAVDALWRMLDGMRISGPREKSQGARELRRAD